MDLSKYDFYATECAAELDEIESALGVKFDRNAMFNREQALWEQLHPGSTRRQWWEQLHPGSTRRQWIFRFSKDPSITAATFSDREPGEMGTTTTETHIESAPHGMVYAKDALLSSLKYLSNKIPDIRAHRQPKPQDKQMTTQDKETVMHEAIARASLVAFAEFIGQPISDINGVFQQALTLYGRADRSIACVVKIPVDKTKPIIASAVDGGPIYDGLKLEGDVVRVSYFLGGSTAVNFKSCAAYMARYAPEALKVLTTERAKQAPPPPAKPEPIPYESECRAHVKRLNKELGINLNEDAVLAAGEVARATYRSGERPIMNYVLSVARASRVASFAILDKDAATPSGVGLVVISTRYYPSNDGLQCALRTLSSPEKVSQVQSGLTPPAPSKPAFTVA